MLRTAVPGYVAILFMHPRKHNPIKSLCPISSDLSPISQIPYFLDFDIGLQEGCLYYTLGFELPLLVPMTCLSLRKGLSALPPCWPQVYRAVLPRQAEGSLSSISFWFFLFKKRPLGYTGTCRFVDLSIIKTKVVHYWHKTAGALVLINFTFFIFYFRGALF